jgi:galactokinase
MDMNAGFTEHIDVERLKGKFLEVYGESPGEIHVFFAPGRVNLIGDHVDYNGGYVLPVALSIGIFAAVRYSETVFGRTGSGSSGRSLGKAEVIHLASINEWGKTSVDLSEHVGYEASRGWANYPVGVIRQLRQEQTGHIDIDCDFKGCQVLYWGNLPVGAGLSSSAAIEVLTAYFMLHPVLGGNLSSVDRIWLAQLCQRAENDFVQVQCGIMDQFAVAMGKKNHAMLLDCSALDYRYVPVRLCDYRLVIMNTGKRRSLGESRYNQRRAECEEALAVIRSHPGYAHIENLAQAEIEQVERTFGLRSPRLKHGLANYSKMGEPVLGRRARHVVTENLRTLLAEQLLSTGDVAGFGRLMTESHISLRDDYEVTGFELDSIVEAALSQECCLGARMTGAGFGGCAIALVRSDCCDAFEAIVGEEYFAKTGLEADFIVCEIEDGARRLQ